MRWFFNLPFIFVAGKSRIHFYICLSQMFEAGVPVSRCFEVLNKQQNSWVMRRVSRHLQKLIAEGESLASAFAKFPGIFSPLEIQLVSFAEKTGHFAKTFAQLAETFQTSSDFTWQFLARLAYPGFLCFVAFTVSPLLNAIVFGGTQDLFILAGWRGAYALLGLITIWILLKILIRISWIRYLFHFFVSLIPFIGHNVRRFARARFAGVLYIMYQAGIPLLYSIEFAAKSCGNAIVQRRVLKHLPKLKEGHRVWQVMEDSRMFSPLSIGLVATGEESGSLDTMLQKFSEWEKKEALYALDMIGKTLTYLIYFGVLLYCAFIIISFWSDYYAQMDKIK